MALSLASITSCGTPSAEELAARPVESDVSLWDEEDYKSVAAKGCLEWEVAFDKGMSEDFGNWINQMVSYAIVVKTTSELTDDPTYGALHDIAWNLYSNALSRASGKDGERVDLDALTEASDICLNLGVDINATE